MTGREVVTSPSPARTESAPLGADERAAIEAHLGERSAEPPQRGIGSSERTVLSIVTRRLSTSASVTLRYSKRDGEWRGSTGAEIAETVQRAALGLLALGVKPGDRVIIMANTRSEWSDADSAILAVGGVTVGIYPTSSPGQARYIAEHSEARIAIVESPEHVEKLEPLMDQETSLDTVIVMDHRQGDSTEATSDRVISWGQLLELDDKGAGSGVEVLERLASQVHEGDLATIIYTSGTTGPPKGVMLTHGSIFAVVESAITVLPVSPEDIGIAFLPLAHSLQRIANYGCSWTGVPGAMATSIDALPDEFREIRPTVQASVPRIWEKFHARIKGDVEQAAGWKQRLFQWAAGVGQRHAEHRRQHTPVPIWLRAQHALADAAVFSKIRHRAGFDRVRFLTCGGAPISPDILEFFHSMGILILEGYGLTETAAPATLNRVEDFRFGTVGKPIPGVRLAIDSDGEVLIKGPGCFRGYYKNPEATEAAYTDDGWFRSGDVGEIDADGFLRLTDRKKDLIKTAAGKYVAPQMVENLVKRSPLISQAMVFGDRRPYVVALVTLDDEEVRAWARRQGLSLPSDPTGLVKDARVVQMVDSVIEQTNAELSRPEQLKRWLILSDDFSQDDETLTPTLKLRRRAIAELYEQELEALYSDRGK